MDEIRPHGSRGRQIRCCSLLTFVGGCVHLRQTWYNPGHKQHVLIDDFVGGFEYIRNKTTMHSSCTDFFSQKSGLSGTA